MGGVGGESGGGGGGRTGRLIYFSFSFQPFFIIITIIISVLFGLFQGRCFRALMRKWGV